MTRQASSPSAASRGTPRVPARLSWLAAFGEALRHIGVVLAFGMALATAFTAFSPPTLLPGQLAEQIAHVIETSQVSGVQPTPLPAIATTVPPRPRLGLVAGHNGPQNDPGAVCPDGLTEALVNYDIATRAQAALEAHGFSVDLLDEFDPRLEGYQALAVVSIHNDSCAYINEFATGYKVAGALDTGAPSQAQRLVDCLTQRYAAETELPYHQSVTPDMTSYHTFYEVFSTTPIAIIETGFLNLDRRILTEEPHRVAQGIVNGILCYLLDQPIHPEDAAPVE